MVKSLNHIAIIVKSEENLAFYKALGFSEISRTDRGYDVIVMMSGNGITLEIFIDPTHPARVTNPEAMGLRHVAFNTSDIEGEWQRLLKYKPEPIRVKPDGKRFFFVKDHDGLPIEFCE